jgi:alpha-beta hydrolase superfamily lysophospholipase
MLMGDSAGGGLAASITMQATDVGLSRPAALVLLSPWLDVTMTDPSRRGGCRCRPGLNVIVTRVGAISLTLSRPCRGRNA